MTRDDATLFRALLALLRARGRVVLIDRIDDFVVQAGAEAQTSEGDARSAIENTCSKAGVL